MSNSKFIVLYQVEESISIHLALTANGGNGYIMLVS